MRISFLSLIQQNEDVYNVTSVPNEIKEEEKKRSELRHSGFSTYVLYISFRNKSHNIQHICVI